MDKRDFEIARELYDRETELTGLLTQIEEGVQDIRISPSKSLTTSTIIRVGTKLHNKVTALIRDELERIRYEFKSLQPNQGSEYTVCIKWCDIYGNQGDHTYARSKCLDVTKNIYSELSRRGFEDLYYLIKPVTKYHEEIHWVHIALLDNTYDAKEVHGYAFMWTLRDRGLAFEEGKTITHGDYILRAFPDRVR